MRFLWNKHIFLYAHILTYNPWKFLERTSYCLIQKMNVKTTKYKREKLKYGNENRKKVDVICVWIGKTGRGFIPVCYFCFWFRPSFFQIFEVLVWTLHVTGMRPKVARSSFCWLDGTGSVSCSHCSLSGCVPHFSTWCQNGPPLGMSGFQCSFVSRQLIKGQCWSKSNEMDHKFIWNPIWNLNIFLKLTHYV